MKFYQKYDIYIICIILVVSFLFWVTYQGFLTDQLLKAEIYYYAELVKTVELEQGIEQKFTIAESPGVIFHLFADGSISFEESDCPHQLCIQSGKLNRPGQFAACLPNGILLKIVAIGDRDRKVDIIIGS